MRKLLFSSVFILSSLASNAQDLEFTQFYANPLYLNPAFAGSNGCARFSVNYRNQWPQLSGNYVSQSAAYDQYFDNISGGFGVIVTNDIQAKTLTTQSLGLIYSYHMRIGRKWTALFGAKAAYTQKRLDWNNLTFGDMIDPRRGFIYATNDVQRGGSRGFFDASAGTVVYNKNFNIGLAANHLNTPNESLIVGDSKLPIRLTAHASANIDLGGNSKYKNVTTIMPSILYSYQRGFQQFNIGTYVKYSNFTAGAYFRNKDAFILTMGVQTEQFRLGYSYDVTVSKLNNGATSGSHEISMQYLVKCRKKSVKFRTISCPTF
jgi:type IX secretion system PorP/SprF family membrane protein